MSNQNQTEDVAQYLLRSIFQMHERCKNLNEKTKKKDEKIKPGIIDNLAGLKFLLRKIRNSTGVKKSIGFFGAQKRGKSTLINLLLGSDLMPTATNPMTSAVVYVENDANMHVNEFSISKEDQGGAIDNHGIMNLEEAREALKEIVSHAGSQSSEVSKVWVKSNFAGSKILEKGGVLVDTPGAECGFEKRNRPRRTLAEKENELDTQRALSALNQVQVVIFVERPEGIESKTSKDLYARYVHDMRPLCVVNFRDKFDLDKKKEERIVSSAKDDGARMKKINEAKSGKLKTKMITKLGAIMERTLCVSCKEARSKNTREGEDAEKDIEKLKNSGISDLEEKIICEIENLEANKGILTCLKDLEKFLAQIEEKDLKIAKDVFASGLTAMCVFIYHAKRCRIPPNEKKGIVNKATELFVKYAPHGRKEYLEEYIQKGCECSDKLPLATSTGTNSKVVSPEKSEDVKGDDHE